jgi:hypothetical protein
MAPAMIDVVIHTKPRPINHAGTFSANSCKKIRNNAIRTKMDNNAKSLDVAYVEEGVSLLQCVKFMCGRWS